MAESSNKNPSGGNRSRNRNRSGDRSRGGGNRSGNRGSSQGRGGNRGGNRGGGGSGGGGNGGRRFVKQKVPRRTRPLSLWEKFLNLFGLGPKRRQPPPSSTASREGNAAASLKSAPTGRPKQTKEKAPQQQGKERPARKPEKVAVSGTRLHVGNLSYDTTDSDLRKLFSEIGPVTSSEVVMHSRSQRSKGFAFVEMENVDDAKRAAAELHDKEFMGRPISVGGAKSARPA